jgi:hypothetical protein
MYHSRLGEPVAPPLIALLVASLLQLLLPDELIPGPRWLVPAIMCLLLLALVFLDPGHVEGRLRVVRWVRLSIALVLAATTTFATVALTHALVVGSGTIVNSASDLLQVGALVWLALLITFSFVYWEFDLGGPVERSRAERRFPDFAFPQDLTPAIAPPGWRPTFVDFLYLGLTNNLAFSPTDVMPLSHWAKLVMGLQSLTSLLLIGLVIARAVNIFG